MTPRLFLLAALLPAAAAAQSMHGGGHSAGTHGDGAMDAYMGAMDGMMDAMTGMENSGDADVDFMLMMIPHHQAAVDMAQALLDRGGDDPEALAMARAVIATQTAEIEAMRARLVALGFPAE